MSCIIAVIVLIVSHSKCEALQLHMKTAKVSPIKLSTKLTNPLEIVVNLNQFSRLQQSPIQYQLTLESEILALKSSGKVFC